MAERPPAGRSLVSQQPIKRTFLPPRTLVRASHCSAVTFVWPRPQGIRILRAETVVAERSAGGRSPVMQHGSQSSASLSSTYARLR